MSVPTIPDEPNQGLSSNVADMIRMASMCHPSIENGRAHLVWVVIARQRTLSQLAVEWKHFDCNHQKESCSGPRGHEGRAGAARTHRPVLVWMAARTAAAPFFVIAIAVLPFDSQLGRDPLPGEHHPYQMSSPIFSRWHIVAMRIISATLDLNP